MDGLQFLVFKTSLTHTCLSGMTPLAELPPEAARDYVRFLWGEIESELPTSQRFPDPEFEVSDNVRDGMPLRVFRLPTRPAVTDAWYVGLLVEPGTRRVFLLEQTRFENYGILLEWTRHERRAYETIDLSGGVNASDFTALVAQFRHGVPPRVITPGEPIFSPSIRDYEQIVRLREHVRAVSADARRRSQELLASLKTDPAAAERESPDPPPWWRFWRRKP